MDLKARLLPGRDAQKDTQEFHDLPMLRRPTGAGCGAGLQPRAHGLSGAGASGLAGRAPCQGSRGVRIYHPYY